MPRRYASDELQHKSPGNKAVQAVSILELDQELGADSLDRQSFDNLLRRFAVAFGIVPGQVRACAAVSHCPYIFGDLASELTPGRCAHVPLLSLTLLVSNGPQPAGAV